MNDYYVFHSLDEFFNYLYFSHTINPYENGGRVSGKNWLALNVQSLEE